MILFICPPFFALRQIIADSVPASGRHCVSSGNTGPAQPWGWGCGVGSQEGLGMCAFFFFCCVFCWLEKWDPGIGKLSYYRKRRQLFLNLELTDGDSCQLAHRCPFLFLQQGTGWAGALTGHLARLRPFVLNPRIGSLDHDWLHTELSFPFQ